ncbi:hypothetical protein BX667DRAFT_471584, partial [Coemansia mojavensis]
CFSNGSKVTYPDSVSCFKCTVCTTINDLKELVRTEKSTEDGQVVVRPRVPPPPLTLDRLRAGVQAYKRHPEKHMLLEAMIRESFGNWDVHAAYKLILSLPPPFIRAMMSAIEQTLRRPGRPLTKLEDIRYLLIIIENPLLMQQSFPQESSYHHHIVKSIVGSLANLPNRVHYSLVLWQSQQGRSSLKRKVQLVNQFISYRVQKYDRALRHQHDWRLVAAARVMALLHAANLLLPTRMDLVADYDAWQARVPDAFSFCQYPFLLSLRAKMQIMQADAARQMDSKLKEAVISALFQSYSTRRAAQSQPHLKLLVRRRCLVEDSLHQLASHEQDLKKRLKIEFVGEEGVDAGGLTKEWFMLLLRELLNPMYGMFTCESEGGESYWFNPAALETSNQFFLVGVVVGLALYNSTILDLHLPLAVFKKLLRTGEMLTDVAQFRPELSRGLRQLLQYRGDDVEDVFCLTFEASYDAYGEVVTVPLVPNGSSIAVTSHNRVEFVLRYLQWVLNDSIAKQFEPFRRGFYYVCGSNALSLFKPEEIELMVHGSGEDWDPEALVPLTEYHGFSDQTKKLVEWFWQALQEMSTRERKLFLAFITGSDRLPTVMTRSTFKLKLMLLGAESNRLPIAHTCFNQLGLWQYRTKDELKHKLMMAINESEGFGLK